MKLDELKDRFSKLKPRAEKLWELYPLLVVAILLIGATLGFLVSKL